MTTESDFFRVGMEWFEEFFPHTPGAICTYASSNATTATTATNAGTTTATPVPTTVTTLAPDNNIVNNISCDTAFVDATSASATFITPATYEDENNCDYLPDSIRQLLTTSNIRMRGRTNEELVQIAYNIKKRRRDSAIRSRCRKQQAIDQCLRLSGDVQKLRFDVQGVIGDHNSIQTEVSVLKEELQQVKANVAKLTTLCDCMIKIITNQHYNCTE
jgi:hypothetical protein